MVRKHNYVELPTSQCLPGWRIWSITNLNYVSILGNNKKKSPWTDIHMKSNNGILYQFSFDPWIDSQKCIKSSAYASVSFIVTYSVLTCVCMTIVTKKSWSNHDIKVMWKNALCENSWTIFRHKMQWSHFPKHGSVVSWKPLRFPYGSLRPCI